VIPGDLNGDERVDVQDLLIMLAAWGPCPDVSVCEGDIDCDLLVTVTDLLELLANWTS